MKLYSKNTGSHIIEISQIQNVLFISMHCIKPTRTAYITVRPSYLGGCEMSISGNSFSHCPNVEDAGIKIYLVLSSFSIRKRTLENAIKEIDVIINKMFF